MQILSVTTVYHRTWENDPTEILRDDDVNEYLIEIARVIQERQQIF
jgi:hypothetical protein